MDQNLRIDLVERVSSPQHTHHSSAAELRAQSIHRLQVGVMGLCSMLLLISLANVIMNRARISEALNGVQKAPVAQTPARGPGDPFADIGVAPSTVSDATNKPKAH